MAERIKGTNQLTLTQEDYPELSGWPNIITGVLLSESRKLEGGVRERFEDAVLL